MTHAAVADWSMQFWPAFANHLWRATLLAVLALGALRLLRMPHRYRYATYLVAGSALIWPAATIASLIPAPPRSASTLRSQWPPALGASVRRVAAPIASDGARVSMGDDNGHPETACLLTLGWLTGGLASIVLWLLQLRQHFRLVRSARPASPHTRETLVRVCDAVGWRRPVHVAVSSMTSGPSVYGIIDATVLLPDGLAESLSEPELAALLAHELVHLESWDNLVGGIQGLVRAAFWFHPLVLWLDRALIEERELRCDELVMARFADAGTYAASLLKTVRFSVHESVAGVSYAVKSGLQRRIAMITTPAQRRPVTWHRLMAPAAGGLIAGLSVVAALAAAPAPARLEDGREWTRIAPFTGVRWRDGVTEVEVGETWSELVSVDGILVGRIVDHCKKTYPRPAFMWQKRLSEDLVEMLREVGHQPGLKVRLELKDAGAPVTRKVDATMTSDKRQQVWRRNVEQLYRLDVDKNGVPIGPAATGHDGLRAWTRTAPFTGVRWRKGTTEVEVQEQWAELVSIDGVPTARILEHCRQTYPQLWQKRFSEDLVDMLADLGHEAGEIVRLELRDRATGSTRTIEEALNKSKRRRVWSRNQDLAYGLDVE